MDGVSSSRSMKLITSDYLEVPDSDISKPLWLSEKFDVSTLSDDEIANNEDLRLSQDDNLLDVIVNYQGYNKTYLDGGLFPLGEAKCYYVEP